MATRTVDRAAGELAPVEEHVLSIREQRVLLDNVSWDLFQRLTAEDEDRRVPRIAYDNGALEFMTPSRLHESIVRTLQALVDRLTDAWNLDLVDAGSTTMFQELLHLGVETDSAHFIQHATAARRDHTSAFPEGFPPDLIVEVEISRTLISRLSIYAAMGVPEVWRASARRVDIYLLEGGQYHEVAVSAALPLLSVEKLNEFLASSQELTRGQWNRVVTTWASEVQED